MVAVEFRVLGQLEVCVDGRTVDVGHARQRCVLAVLLIEVNRPVSPDLLIDRVWAGRDPQRARNTLSGYVSRLRRALATAGGAALLWQPNGYMLTADPLAVDLHRFAHLLDQARASGDDSEALALFDEALGLWRDDEAFAGLDTPWLHEVRAVRDAERFAAELDRNDLALARGQHARLLAGLVERSAANPLDERLAGQLMLALYRSGRQADALFGYERMRCALVEELGADPSPPLRELHSRMLANDPALIAPERAAPPVAASAGLDVPRQLPAPLRLFRGRTREIATLDAFAGTPRSSRAAPVIAAISGMAGVGKTALAMRWAYRAASRFPDGQLYLNLRGFDPSGSPVEAGEAVRALLDALGTSQKRIPASVEAQIGLYRSLLAGRRILIVLDNARDADQVRPLLPGVSGCMVVVTSRDQLVGLVATDGARPLQLDLLSEAESRDVLAARIGRRRVTAESDAVNEIVNHCARLPLALSIVAARAAVNPTFPLGGDDELHGCSSTVDR